ncbi:hypothetical protein [Nonomuraea sp. NPDC050643]|uniref:hypothetical protein n=1 Tax=Nonomuraea sp. NPDC050643 TaxID=3155660 RepID=UPI0033C0E84E
MLEMGDVVVMPLPLGGHGACQVTGVRDGLVMVCALDWRSDSPPVLGDLRDAGPLSVDHHSWEGGPKPTWVSADVPLPAGFVVLGSLPLHAAMPRECDSYGPWEGEALQVELQRHWDLRLPAAAKAAYKAASARQVEVDLGGPPLRRPGQVSRLDLREHRDEVRWAGLDALPQVTTLSWAGAERGLVRALEGRPMITALTWEDPPDEVDVSRTGLRGLVFPGRAPRRLALPAELMSLRLGGAAPEVVTAASAGRWITLALVGGVAAPDGLRGVRDLELDVTGEAVVPAAAGLESLRVRWAGSYGALAGLDGFDRLHTLELSDAYGVEAAMLPAPGGPLRRLGISCLRSSQVRAIKQRYRGSEVAVRISGAKSDKWLAVNIDNPLRDWVDDHKRGGAAACRAYAAAERAIEGLGVDDHPAAVADARGILREFVERLNTIEERHGMIDTVLREEAFDAFMGLARRAGVPHAEAGAWFDGWHDF